MALSYIQAPFPATCAGMKRSLDVDQEPQRANEQKARLLNLLGDMVLRQENALVTILRRDTSSDCANLAPTIVEVSTYVQSLTINDFDGTLAAKEFIRNWEARMIDNNIEPWTIQDVRAVGVLHFLMAIFIKKVHIHETEDVLMCACCRCELGNEERRTWVTTHMEVFICEPCSRLSGDEKLEYTKLWNCASTASSASASTASSASTADGGKPPRRQNNDTGYGSHQRISLSNGQAMPDCQG